MPGERFTSWLSSVIVPWRVEVITWISPRASCFGSLTSKTSPGMPLLSTRALRGSSSRSGAANAVAVLLSDRAVTSRVSVCRLPAATYCVMSNLPPGNQISPAGLPSSQTRAWVCNIVNSSRTRRPDQSAGTSISRRYQACSTRRKSRVATSPSALRTRCTADRPPRPGQIPGTLNQSHADSSAGGSPASPSGTGEKHHSPLRHTVWRVGELCRQASVRSQSFVFSRGTLGGALDAAVGHAARNSTEGDYQGSPKKELSGVPAPVWRERRVRELQVRQLFPSPCRRSTTPRQDGLAVPSSETRRHRQKKRTQL